MKTLLLPLALALATGACAPGTFGENLPLDLAAQTIPGDAEAHAAATAALASGVGALPIMTVTVDEPSQDTSGAIAVLLEALALEVTTGVEANDGPACWDFVRSVSVYVESAAEGSALPRVLVAQGGAPGCVSSMDLAPAANVDLKPYASEGMRLELEATGVPPSSSVTFVTHLVLRAAWL